jgi:hypothetical protein
LKIVELNKWNYELDFLYPKNVKEYKMARLPRLSLTDCPQHIIQRGNNRQACFFAEQDYNVYLDITDQRQTSGVRFVEKADQRGQVR